MPQSTDHSISCQKSSASIGGAASAVPFPVELLARIQFEFAGRETQSTAPCRQETGNRIRLSAFIARYTQDYLTLKASKSLRQESNRLRRIQALFEDDPYVDEITSGQIEKLLATVLGAGRSPATYNRYRARLNSLFRKAVDWAYRTDNPVERIDRLRETPIGAN